MQQMTPVQVKTLASRNCLFHATIDEHHALYIPAGFAIAERVVTGDAWGVSAKFILLSYLGFGL